MFAPMNRKVDSEEAIQSALANALVLHQIFIHLPTEELMECCSLVNKLWNIQARTVVRNYRELRMDFFSSGDRRICRACHRLRNFETYLGIISVVPMNHIVIRLRPENDPRNRCNRIDEDHPVDPMSLPKIVRNSNLARMRVTTLTLHIVDTNFACPLQYFAAQLLMKHSSELRTLYIRGISPIVVRLLQGWTPAFPKLEEINIGGHPHTIIRKYKDVYARFIRGSPVLKAVTTFLGSMSNLHCIFPDDTYLRLLKTYDLCMVSPRDELKWLKIGGAGPALVTLNVHYPGWPSTCNFDASFYKALEQILHSSRNSLESLHVLERSSSTSIFTSIKWPTMKELTVVEISTPQTTRQMFAVLLGSIDYQNMLPALVEFRVQANFIDNDGDEVTMGHEVQCRHVSKTAKVLEISAHFRSLHTTQLRLVFPKLVSITLHSLSPSNLPSFSKLFSLWPKLKKLVLKSNCGDETAWPNVDAAFCGISREEAKTLWGKDEKFLRALHIVPTRRGVSVLKRLKILELKGMGENGLDPSKRFLTKVTVLLAFERMPQTKVSAFSSMGMPLQLA